MTTQRMWPSAVRIMAISLLTSSSPTRRSTDGPGAPADAPVNALGIRRVMFAVDDLDAVLSRLLGNGAELVGEVVEFEDSYRLCYVPGPEGIMVALAQTLG